jgi:hypothetical protein
MAEVLAQFPQLFTTTDGSKYVAQACGAPNADGLWDGWIEFLPTDGQPPVRSSRETTQPNRTDAEYWASGLTAIYLEGALDRALNPPVRRVVAPPTPRFDGPAPDVTFTTVPPASEEAVLDPFSVYEKGEKLLRQELGALAAWHLVNIALAYGLSDEPASVLNALPAAQLVELIVAGVRSRVYTRK